MQKKLTIDFGRDTTSLTLHGCSLQGVIDIVTDIGEKFDVIDVDDVGMGAAIRDSLIGFRCGKTCIKENDDEGDSPAGYDVEQGRQRVLDAMEEAGQQARVRLNRLGLSRS